jgi:hypothetical protein
LIKEGPVVEGLTIMEYFMAILTGHVLQSQLFLVPFDEEENKSDDKIEEEEGKSSESDDDLEKTPETRQKSNRVKNPTKQNKYSN